MRQPRLQFYINVGVSRKNSDNNKKVERVYKNRRWLCPEFFIVFIDFLLTFFKKRGTMIMPNQLNIKIGANFLFWGVCALFSHAFLANLIKMQVPSR